MTAQLEESDRQATELVNAFEEGMHDLEQREEKLRSAKEEHASLKLKLLAEQEKVARI